jgi:nucleoside phosphorylase
MATAVLEIKKTDAERLLVNLLNKEVPGSEIQAVRILDNDSDRCDCGLIVALQEEFKVIFPRVNPTAVYDKEIEHYFYVFEHQSTSGCTYRCVATFIGGMGPVKAALSTDRLVRSYSPLVVINIGIAGSMDNDLLLGDVVVAEQADDYLYQSKAVSVPNRNGFEFRLNGDPYKTSRALIEHAKNLEFAHEDAVSEWCCDAEATFKSCVEDQHRYKLLIQKVVREKPKLDTGNLASSTVVGAATEFVSWLKNRDRKYLAIEMEAAGVLCATYGMSTETVIIRGISDLADDRKQEMDGIGGGGLRRYAMENAISILLTYMRLGLFPHRNSGTAQLTIPIAVA